MDQTLAHQQSPAVEPLAPTQGPAKKGPGEQKLEALLAAGRPDPAAVVKILDAHRGERTAIMAMLHAQVGNAYVTEVLDAADKLRIDLKRREVVAGDPSNPDSDYFVASQEKKGAEFRAADGAITGTLDKKGLQADYHLDEDSSIHLGVDPKKREASLGYVDEGRTVGEVYGGFRSSTDWAAGGRAPLELRGGEGRVLTPEYCHQVGADGSRDLLGASYRDSEQSGSAFLGRHEAGATVGSAAYNRTLSPSTSLAASAGLEPGSWSLAGSMNHRVNDQQSVYGSLSHTQALDGSSRQTSLSLGERYTSPGLIHGLDIAGTTGTQDRLTGSGYANWKMTEQMYAGTWGSFTAERGKDPVAQIGASLTFLPTEKTALTLAGVVDQNGAFATRLQLDVLKSRIENVSELSSGKKSQLFLFLEASQGMSGGLDRFGKSQLSTGIDHEGKVVTFGVGINF